MLQNISVILVNPKGSRNIGMAARAMKNFDITSLVLVDPVNFKLREAHEMACGAKDVVDSAARFNGLSEALSGFTCSFAFSRRMAKNRIPYYSLQEALPRIAERSRKGKISLVFGREADGLTREELYQCDYRVYIPTSNEWGSLNLAQAVILVCYEIFCNNERRHPRERGDLVNSRDSRFRGNDMARYDNVSGFFAPRSEVASMLKDLQRLLIEIGYTGSTDEKLRKKIVQAFGEIVGRAGLRHKDVNMFLGLWSQVRKNL
jgi:tRNA/rRNA methyltransferase